MITPFVVDLSNYLPSIPFFLQQKMNILGFVNCTYLEKFLIFIFITPAKIIL